MAIDIVWVMLILLIFTLVHAELVKNILFSNPINIIFKEMYGLPATVKA